MSDANDRQETIADIADEIKRAVESMGDEIPYTTSVGTMRRVADRIKEAAKREREALDELVANIEMRASVFGIFSIIDRKTFLDAKAALSAPARNCDRFADETDAQIAFLNEVWLISVTKETMLEQDKIENWTAEMRIAYAKWLLSTAAERKGEGDGR